MSDKDLEKAGELKELLSTIPAAVYCWLHEKGNVVMCGPHPEDGTKNYHLITPRFEVFCRDVAPLLPPELPVIDLRNLPPAIAASYTRQSIKECFPALPDVPDLGTLLARAIMGGIPVKSISEIIQENPVQVEQPTIQFIQGSSTEPGETLFNYYFKPANK